jgi:hypothetical protein
MRTWLLMALLLVKSNSNSTSSITYLTMQPVASRFCTTVSREEVGDNPHQVVLEVVAQFPQCNEQGIDHLLNLGISCFGVALYFTEGRGATRLGGTTGTSASWGRESEARKRKTGRKRGCVWLLYFN